ncbi:MAG: hypothetical protein JSV24_04510 [Bacteroidales bacterium]|nr:MAG: hypothetical protein JSV24_04510 [Bacteroidales bacterium]
MTGWISYTLSKTERQFEEINQGKLFPANYDRRHDFSLVGQYKFTERLMVSLNWIFSSGAPITFPTGRFVYGNVVIPVYTERNAYRMPDYHRLDLAIRLKGKQTAGKRFRGEWSFSIYNVYNRKNAWMIFFKSNDEYPTITEAYKLYMFPIVPAVSYHVRF